LFSTTYNRKRRKTNTYMYIVRNDEWILNNIKIIERLFSFKRHITQVIMQHEKKIQRSIGTVPETCRTYLPSKKRFFLRVKTSTFSFLFYLSKEKEKSLNFVCMLTLSLCCCQVECRRSLKLLIAIAAEGD
jgi:hypothetical protein